MVLSMKRWVDKVAIVTGAGGGIGEEIVQHLVEEGLRVVGIDNRPDSLDELSKKIRSTKGTLYTFALDITQDEEVSKLFRRITEEIGQVHILVNCAGISPISNLVGGDVQIWRKTFDVNVIGLCNMTSEAAKIMKENNIEGHIVHISSEAGHKIIPLPGISAYTASKHAVVALTESLRLEFNQMGLKIKITCICPGAVDTSIAQRNNMEELEEMFNKFPKVKPDDIADAIVYALSTPPHVQVQEIIVKPVGEKF